MCGFAGFVDFSNTSEEINLQKMCTSIAHRGPDAAGYFFDKNASYTIGLGHRRLSVIDVTEQSNQPFYYKDFVLIFNGEIYNYKEIKQELSSLGHTFSTHSDTEVIIHGYEQWGEHFVEKCIGMFAIVIFNKQTELLTLLVDRPGVKPLHYYWDGAVFIFGSELKTIMHHPQFKKDINQLQLEHYFQLGHVPAPHTIFKNTLKNGTWATYHV